MAMKERMVGGFACLVTLVALGGAGTAWADEMDDLNEQVDAVEERIAEEQAKLDEASIAYNEALDKKDEAERELGKSRERQAEIRNELEELDEHVGEIAVFRYKTDALDVLDLLMGAGTVREFADTMEALDALNDYDKRVLEDLRTAQADWRRSAAETEASEQEAIERQRKAEAIKVKAEDELERLRKEHDELDKKIVKALEERRRREAASQSAVAVSAGGSTNWSGAVAPDGSNEVVARAYSALGSPYVWGAVGPSSYDCSGLVSYCVTGAHVRLGTAATFCGFPRTDNPEPGDIVTTSSHCGIYIGGGKMIHAADYGIGVIIGNVQSGMIAVKAV